MIRQVKRRFILGAMSAFSLLLALLIGGMTAVSYGLMERSTDQFLAAMLADAPANAQAAPPSMFGYEPAPRTIPAGFYDIRTDATGAIVSVETRGIAEAAEVAVQRAVAQALRTGAASGKAGAYKYRVRWEADGSARMILLDNSIALQSLYNTLLGALGAALACLLMLLIILQPVAGRFARTALRNAEGQKRFITNASHELKTPVAAILANLDALELHAGESRWSANIRAQAGRMSAMLGQLLLLARADEVQLTGRAAAVDLVPCLRQALTDSRERLEARGIGLTLALPDALPLQGNRQALEQLLAALVDNAARYAAPGGSLSVRLEALRGRARLILENTVEALPACPPEALFERFFRGDAARTAPGGCGVGLSAARSIAEMHRGRIRAEYVQPDRFRVVVELSRKGA